MTKTRMIVLLFHSCGDSAVTDFLPIFIQINQYKRLDSTTISPRSASLNRHCAYGWKGIGRDNQHLIRVRNVSLQVTLQAHTVVSGATDESSGCSDTLCIRLAVMHSTSSASMSGHSIDSAA